jgi:hypothetical protein
LTTDVDDLVCRTTIDFVGDEDHPAFSEKHTQRLHMHEELRSALVNSGFTVLAVTDEYSDAAETDTTLRTTWVARLEET